MDELLELHPWPDEWAGERRLQWLWHFDLPVPAHELWRVVSDTSRLNRSLGVGEMTFEEEAGLRRGTSVNGAVRHEWIEVPWNWVAGQWLECVRRYDRGYPKVIYAIQRLEPVTLVGDSGSHTTGTRLYVYFGAVPRGPLSPMALRVGFAKIGRAYARVMPQIAAEIERLRPVVLLAPPPAMPVGAEARLEAIARALIGQGLNEEAVSQLAEWIRTGDEQDLHRIQVRERARAWDVDEDELLRVCLHATRAGMLELSWDIVCPHCRGVTDGVGKLGDLPADGSCEVCAIDFSTGAAEAIEITFQVHPSIRPVVRRTYCSAEPATKQHIQVQCAVAPGGAEWVRPQLGIGRWRLRLHGEKRYGYLTVGRPGSHGGNGAPAEEVSSGEVVWRAADAPRDLTVPAAPMLHLINDTPAPRTFVVEAIQWSDVALRPGKVLSFPEFRDLFAEEYLADDVQLAVGEQTILFSDMVGSTAMYAQRGDPAAFVEVKKHFAELFEIVRRHNGAVVKTIGDAAMAAFCDPLDAIHAARDIHLAFAPGRADSTVRLRVALHTGPCLAVKLNSDIDYFGNTVNLAAKLQSLASAWQIAMTEATYHAPGVAEWLEEHEAKLEEVTLAHPALAVPMPARRWTVHRRT